jgi:glycosyltransferase involved in cell wall biosynthesis
LAIYYIPAEQLKISIITVTYNSGATVRDTLESVKNQTYIADIEHIIVDGASKDETLAIVKEYPHVAKVISEKDKGIYDAMNKGVRLATGDVIGILNSDDIFASNDIIANILSVFEKDKSIDAIYGNISYFRTEEPEKVVRFWKSKPYYNTFFEDGEIPPHPSLFLRKKVYDSVGLYDPNFKISSDYDLMFRSFKLNHFVPFYLNETIVKMRMGGESTKNWKNILIGNKEVITIWKRNNISIPYTFYIKRFFKKIAQYVKK